MSRNNKIPSVIKAVGLTSFFINTSTLIIFSFFAIYLKDVLHINLSKLGFLDGAVESISYLMKVFSGYLSDLICNRKILFLAGSILLLIAKPLEATCTKFLPLFLAKAMERLGNGLQSTPRDAIVCDWSNKENKNICFGFRQSMASLGSLVGAILAAILFYHLRDFQKVFWCSCIPAVIAVFIVMFFVRNKNRTNNSVINNNESIAENKQHSKIKLKDIRNLSKEYWTLLSVAGLYNIAKITDSMSLIYVTYVWKLDLCIVPLFFAIFHVGASVAAYSAGIIANKLKRIETIFIFGIIIFIFADMLFIFCENNLPITIMAMFCLGAYSGIANSTFPAQISGLVPDNLRGTGLGIYNLACALSLLCGGTLLGFIAEHSRIKTSFYISACIASIALVFLIIYRHVKHKN